MNIDFSKLDFNFTKKPIVVGGLAMEYYNLRKTGADIDLIATQKDVISLAQKYPTKLKDLWGDFGVAIFEFEIWKTIRYLDYDWYVEGAIEKENVFIISLERLLHMKALAHKVSDKYLVDLGLITDKLNSDSAGKYDAIKNENEQIVKRLGDAKYVEKTGPDQKKPQTAS